MPSRWPARPAAGRRGPTLQLVGQHGGDVARVGGVEHHDGRASGDLGDEELARAHGGEDDAVDLAVEHGGDGLGLARRVAAGLEHEHDVARCLGGLERALDQAARETGGGDDVGDESDGQRLVGAQAARRDVGSVAERLGGGVDAVVGVLRQPRVGPAVEDHRGRRGREPGQTRDVGQRGPLARHRVSSLRVIVAIVGLRRSFAVRSIARIV